MKRKKENPPTAIKDKDGNLLEKKDEIMSRYLEHFVDVLQPPKASSKEEEKQEDIISTVFDNISRIASQGSEAVTNMNEVEIAISELKKNKCKDEWGWRNEILVAGKDEMKISLMTYYMIKKS